MERIHIWMSDHINRVRGVREERHQRSAFAWFEAPRGIRATIYFPDGRVIKEWSRALSASLYKKNDRVREAPRVLVKEVSLLPLRRALPFKRAVGELLSRVKKVQGVKRKDFDTSINRMQAAEGKEPFGRPSGVEVLIDPIYSIVFILKEARDGLWFIEQRFSQTDEYYRSIHFPDAKHHSWEPPK